MQLTGVVYPCILGIRFTVMRIIMYGHIYPFSSLTLGACHLSPVSSNSKYMYIKIKIQLSRSNAQDRMQILLLGMNSDTHVPQVPKEDKSDEWDNRILHLSTAWLKSSECINNDN